MTVAVAPTEPTFIGNLYRGKRILVAGAGGSIGVAICRLLASLGGHLIVIDEIPERLSLLSQALNSQGFKVDSRALELRDSRAVRFLFNVLWWKGEAFDVVINCVDPANTIHDTRCFLEEAAQLWLQESQTGTIVNIFFQTDVEATDPFLPGSDLSEWINQRIRINALAILRNQVCPERSGCSQRYSAGTEFASEALFASSVADVAAFLGSDASKLINATLTKLDGNRLASA